MASMSVPCPKICASNRVGSISRASTRRHRLTLPQISFPPPTHRFEGSHYQSFNRNQSGIWTRHATADEKFITNSAPVPDGKVKPESLNGKPESAENSIPNPAALSAFMERVSGLIKLVDSRDIAELELKELDSEVIIRKKEALQQPAAVASPPVYSMPMSAPPAQPAAPAPPSPSPSAAPAAASSAPPKASPSPSHPPVKCPMAGTFYRSPAPGEPPFVKVGDKVQKGQVICIIEAMKLMNEIEADQSGTITEILAEDGKGVSIDTPLFVIVP